MEIPGNASTVGNLTKSGQAAGAIAKNFDTFLKLLTTQMQNQDPLEPMDNHEFTQQLVQFSGVEQAIATNRNLELMLGMMLSSQSATAVGYIGKEVLAEADTATLADGEARWTYELDGNASKTAITVSDASGKLVYVASGALASGTHDFVWDGKDNSGKPLPDGQYTLEVVATGPDDALIGTRTLASGIVTGVETRNGEPSLLIGDIAVPLSTVLRVSEPQQTG